MKKLITWAVVAAGVTGFAGVGVVACSSGSSSDHPGTDASADGTSSESSTKDGTTSDVVTAEGGKDSATDATDGGPGEASATCEVYDASALSDASVAAGFDEVWQVYKCYSCHQKKSQIVDDAGKGIVLSGNNDGLGDSGTTFPPNLTPDPTTGVGCWTDQQLADAILNGKDNEGGALCPSMPRWGNAILTADGGDRPGTPMDAGTAHEIIDYLRSLPPVVNAVPDTTCGDGGTSVTDGGDASSDAGDSGHD